MRFIDMFAGIGGFHLGMEQAGHQCVGWVEWDKFARQSYQAIHNVKGMWNASDIRTVRASELPRADCWCFGFPCQDISVAGKQKGFTAGKRSSLFFTVTGLIRDLEEEDRPSYLLIENVKNLLSINRGLDFLKLQIELDEIGYDVEWSVLDSAEVVPQHRERIFIIGHLRGRRTRKVFPIIRKNGETTESNVIKIIGNTSNTGFRSEDVLASTGISTTLMSRDYKGPKQVAIKQVGNISNSKSFGGNPQVGRVYGTDGIAPTLSTMQGGGQEPKILNDYRIRKLTPLETWRLQGFPDWAFERAKKAGLSDSQLYKQAGNSVTVPVIKAIAENMAFETIGED
ncbi:DNA-cytosine methyltransferase [Lactiplantibacillus plantarum]|nr:DNA-cytosine methyltransferase [Lactiplantibacillus plantarum]